MTEEELDEILPPEDLGKFTVEWAEWMWTPQQAAHIKYMVAMLDQAAGGRDPHMEDLINNNPGHRMFCYVLDVIARRA
jgi:hypothetical protein